MSAPAGRAALVTGGTSGIGRAVVERLASAGLRVAFTGRDATRGAEVERLTGATFVPLDAARLETIEPAVERAVTALGGLDVLVNNAGIIFQGSIAETPPAAWDELMEVNLVATALMARACFAHFRAHGGGAMVHIASDAGIIGSQELAAYSVTKAAVIMLSNMLAAEGAPLGIRSNAIGPGDILPGMRSTTRGFERHAEDPANWDLPPSGRFGEGIDVAEAVLYLVSDAARHVGGATLRVDGGYGVNSDE